MRRAVLREAASGESSASSRCAPTRRSRGCCTGELHGILDELQERYGINVRVFEAPDFHPTRFEVSA